MTRHPALVLGLLLGACTTPSSLTPSPSSPPAPPTPLLVATWPFGREAADIGLATLEEGGSLLDAIELGIRRIETLSSDGSVGLGGRPNAAGYTQLDACIMNGPDGTAGSVAALEGIVHPITAARRVLDSSPHVMLVGEGARWFALEHGLESVPVSDLPLKKQAFVERERDVDPGERGHDTITLLGLGEGGALAGGSSTSGSGGKYPGRVGDSPILGAGLYVDNEVGAAGGTGLGENIMRHCASVRIVEGMRQGLSPRAACEEVIHAIAATDPLGYELSIHLIAVDKQGRHGAASSNGTFSYAVVHPGSSTVVDVPPVERRPSH